MKTEIVVVPEEIEARIKCDAADTPPEEEDKHPTRAALARAIFETRYLVSFATPCHSRGQAI